MILILVDTASDNDLLPHGIEPLPEPVLTYGIEIKMRVSFPEVHLKLSAKRRSFGSGLNMLEHRYRESCVSCVGSWIFTSTTENQVVSPPHPVVLSVCVSLSLSISVRLSMSQSLCLYLSVFVSLHLCISLSLSPFLSRALSPSLSLTHAHRLQDT